MLVYSVSLRASCRSLWHVRHNAASVRVTQAYVLRICTQKHSAHPQVNSPVSPPLSSSSLAPIFSHYSALCVVMNHRSMLHSFFLLFLLFLPPLFFSFLLFFPNDIRCQFRGKFLILIAT